MEVKPGPCWHTNLVNWLPFFITAPTEGRFRRARMVLAECSYPAGRNKLLCKSFCKVITYTHIIHKLHSLGIYPLEYSNQYINIWKYLAKLVKCWSITSGNTGRQHFPASLAVRLGSHGWVVANGILAEVSYATSSLPHTLFLVIFQTLSHPSCWKWRTYGSKSIIKWIPKALLEADCKRIAPLASDSGVSWKQTIVVSWWNFWSVCYNRNVNLNNIKYTYEDFYCNISSGKMQNETQQRIPVKETVE